MATTHNHHDRRRMTTFFLVLFPVGENPSDLQRESNIMFQVHADCHPTMHTVKQRWHLVHVGVRMAGAVRGRLCRTSPPVHTIPLNRATYCHVTSPQIARSHAPASKSRAPPRSSCHRWRHVTTSFSASMVGKGRPRARPRRNHVVSSMLASHHYCTLYAPPPRFSQNMPQPSHRLQ